ncbi:NAD-dependent protein deacetylase [Nocardioides psychrotolerans]|uniref:protein acetyllysine N-acetyltransferase n=1 Tax=Nocardioides psychrotolerans TaxID=1005945 RepID=A0A1I3Q1Q5_9ACTN|nr:Sir2 family NAD-dependent protein deacetylase [Nocardioides psychrotolerans]GEP40654.1 NAD-dependent protein deacetylase [Nocardioides psychrotolerans]SFJ27635.1 NAD-dependent protein deacetylase, SIR2 family [Nocardioides psychrotolerans]
MSQTPDTQVSVDHRDAALALLVGRTLVVLTGAGLSTDSGIPDYRGPGSPSRTPMTYQEFVSGPEAQQRYWARSHLGWGRMRRAEPNAGHRALTALDPSLLITQNVDGLHEAAGSRRLVALHGRIADVICLSCRETTSRRSLHERLAALNPGFDERHSSVETRPDGDVDLEETAGFVVPGCVDCKGVLKPDVVFFGENVPGPRVERCYAAVDALADTGGVLLVAGSSLTVMSGFRFVRRATKLGVAVVIVNRGETRGDDQATYKLEVGCSDFLEGLVAIS